MGRKEDLASTLIGCLDISRPWDFSDLVLFSSLVPKTVTLWPLVWFSHNQTLTLQLFFIIRT